MENVWEITFLFVTICNTFFFYYIYKLCYIKKNGKTMKLFIKILLFGLLVALSFGRVSEKYNEPSLIIKNSAKILVFAESDENDNNVSIKWKRRHKRRKKKYSKQRGK